MNLYQKPSGIWAVDYLDDQGKRRRASTHTRDKVQARIKAREIVMGLSPASAPVSSVPTAGSAQPPPKTGNGVTMDELFRRCELTVWSPREAKSQKTIKSNLKILRAMIGDVPVADMTAGRIEQLSADLFAKGYAAGTVKRKIDMVGKALSLATRWEDSSGRPIITGKPKMPTITAKGARERVLSPEEEVALFETLDRRIKDEPQRDWRRFRAMVRFLLDTAARLGEALNVREEDIEEREVEGRTVTFVHFRRYRTKNDKPRQLPLAASSVAELAYLRLAAVDGRLFPFKGSTPWYMWDNLRDDMKAQGIDISDVVIHSLRHTKLTRLAKDGVPIHKISRFAGHSDIKVTWNSYAHLAPSDLLELV
jgi:integrase